MTTKCAAMLEIKTVDWNQMTVTGNMSREVESGESKRILISDVRAWIVGADKQGIIAPARSGYSSETELKPVLTKTEIWDMLRKWGLATDGQEN